MAYSEEITARLGLDTNSFKEGIAKAKAQMAEAAAAAKKSGEEMASGLNKPIESLEKTERGLKRVSKAFLTGFGAIEVFKQFLEVYKGFAEYAEKFGNKTDINTQATIRWSKALQDSGKDANEAGVQILGYLTRSAELGGSAIGKGLEFVGLKRKGTSEDTTDSDNAANEAEAREKAYKERNDPARVKALEAERKQSERDNKYDSLDENGKINMLLAERLDLQHQLEASGVEALKKQQLQLDLAKNYHTLEQLTAKDTKKSEEDDAKAKEKTQKLNDDILAVQKIDRDYQEEQAQGADKLRMLAQDILDLHVRIAAAKDDDVEKGKLLIQQEEARVKLWKEAGDQKNKADADAEKNGDKSKMSLQELASVGQFQAGVSTDAQNQGSAAREALSLKAQMEKARKNGQTGDYDELEKQYNEKVAGLSSLRDADRGPNYNPGGDDQGSHDSRLDGIISARDSRLAILRAQKSGASMSDKMGAMQNGFGSSSSSAKPEADNLKTIEKHLESIDTKLSGIFVSQ